MLRAWQPGTLLVFFREAVRKRGQGALAKARLPGRCAQTRAARSLVGNSCCRAPGNRWVGPGGAHACPSSSGKLTIPLKTGIHFDPAMLLLRTHSVYRESIFFTLKKIQTRRKVERMVQWTLISSLSRACNSHFVWKDLATRASTVRQCVCRIF